jgi:DNA-binding transcriptional LysR family regulator
MKLHHLRDVIAVAERGSLRAAARHLGIAQPTLTRSIRELEHELGATLFERRARGMTVTPIGERFIQRAASAQSELLRARDEVSQLQGQTRGLVKVCLSSVPHIALLPEVLRPFRQRYPDVILDMTEGVFPTIETDLRNGMFDCYVGPPPVPSAAEGLVVEKLFDNSRVIVARKGHPLAGARSLRQLVDADWLTSSITHKAEEEVAPLFERHGLPAPRLVMRSRSSLTFIMAISNSDLLMMLPVQWLDSPLAKHVLEPIRVKEDLPTPPICIVRRAGLPLTPAAEHFCDLLRRAAGYLAQGKARAVPAHRRKRAGPRD